MELPVRSAAADPLREGGSGLNRRPAKAAAHLGAAAGARPEPGAGPPFGLLAVLVLLAAASAFYRSADADYWFHLSAGRAFARHGFGALDDWSLLSDSSRAWLPEWLFQIALWSVRALAGDAGVALWRCVLAGAAVALALAVARAARCHGWTSALLVPLAIAVARDRQQPRPEQLMVVLVLGYLLVLERARAGAGDRRRWLLPLQVLWANLHATWPAGPAITLLYAPGGVSAGKGRPSLASRLALPLGLAAAGFLSPQPLRTLTLLFATSASSGADPLVSTIEELRRWSWRADAASPFTAWLAVALVAALLGGRRAFRAAPPLALAGLASLALGILAVRFRALAVLASLPAVALALGGVVAVPARPGRALAALSAIAGAFFLVVAPGYPPGVAPRLDAMPVRAAAIADSLGLRGAVLSTFHFGGYLIWARAPGSPPLMDGRGLGSPLLHATFLGANARAPALDSLLEEWRFRCAIVEPPRYPGDRFAVNLQQRPDWCLVFADDAALLFVPRAADSALCHRLGYRYLTPDYEEMAKLGLRASADPAFADSLAAELERARGESPWHARASLWLGLLDLGRGRARDAARLLDEVERLAPLTPGLALRQALAHERAGDLKRARQLYRRALRDPEVASIAREALQRLR